MQKPRTLIIGLDGATFDLLEPWTRAGYLPVIAKLMDHGIHGPLCVWPNMNSAAAWSSLITGYNSGQHGIFDFGERPTQRGVNFRPITGADRKKDPFWRILSAAGEKVGVINVPISYPADPLNGFMLSGMDAPGINSPGFSYPPDLCDELRQQGIDYVIDVPNLSSLSSRNPLQVPWLVERMIDARCRTILYLMKTQPWNVLMAVFIASDRMQHYFWPRTQASFEDAAWEPIRKIYKKIDSFLRDVLALIDDNTTVLLVSDHGFGPALRGQFFLNRLFAQLGLLGYGHGTNQLKGKILKKLLPYSRQIIPHRLQHPLARAFPNLHGHALSETVFSGIDWSQTHVFAAFHGGSVTINLEGRQPEGIIPPKDYHSLRERIRGILLNLTDEKTGRPIILAVHRSEELYHGPWADKSGDLIIQWDYDALGDSLCYRFGERPIIVRPLKKTRFSDEWKGFHRPMGIFIAYGPHIKPGIRGEISIYDIAPTILYLQDHPVFQDMDGKVLIDIFKDEYVSRHPVRQIEPPDIESHEPMQKLDEEERHKIEERLRGLGYIE